MCGAIHVNNQSADNTYAELKEELLHALFMLRNLHFRRMDGRKEGLGGAFRRDMMGNETGISMPAFALLKDLQEREARGETGGAWLSDMKDYLCVSKAAVSQMLGGLENRGFITRETDPENRRTILVKLTEEGRDVIERFERRFDSNIGMVIENLGEKDTREMIRLIYRLAEITQNLKLEPEAETIHPEAETIQ